MHWDFTRIENYYFIVFEYLYILIFYIKSLKVCDAFCDTYNEARMWMCWTAAPVGASNRDLTLIRYVYYFVNNCLTGENVKNNLRTYPCHRWGSLCQSRGERAQNQQVNQHSWKLLSRNVSYASDAPCIWQVKMSLFLWVLLPMNHLEFETASLAFRVCLRDEEKDDQKVPTLSASSQSK